MTACPPSVEAVAQRPSSRHGDRLFAGMHGPRAAAAALFVFAATAVPAAAQQAAGSYPNRPIRLIVPYGAGGVSDILGRTLAGKMSELIGQAIAVENRAGAAGVVGSDVVANSAPDGYTILFSSIGAHAISPHMLKKLPFNPSTAFTSIGGVALSTSAMAVGANQPMKTVKDVIARAKGAPGKVIYGSSGIGSIGHLTGEILSLSASVEMTHVPFKTVAVAYPDAISGSITMVIDTLPSMMQHLKSGSIRPLAMLSPNRSAAFPDVPTIAEAGFPDATLIFWSALHGPANLPQPIVQRVGEALNKSLAASDLRERFATLGAEPWAATPKELDNRVRLDFERLGKVIRAAGIQPE